ncbi:MULTISPECIES: flagellar export chaperone FliS [Alkalimonas]|uniref:Flagellar secretion chaperone FliS n=2 Tax=Alkalimonas TaxID=265980 RepID=A0ABU7J3X9_9GAMM|nr:MULTISPECIES: flagellar export chaperone FliS [unclassified Alkalimonas]MEE2001195.1 flagellar export chaperone FliS [Alkalimonas sp. MEB108]MEE2025824.1 flagellar export chaperone FliS [Alkalimonas sp. MEB004]
MSYGIKAYKSVGIKDDLAVADPHRVIQLLMQGALENMAKAKGCIERQDYAGKSATLSKAISIISALQGSLDMSAGDISDNLYALYDFMLNHLILASREKSSEKVDEVVELLLTIKGAWDQIPVADREKGYELQAQRQQIAVGS